MFQNDFQKIEFDALNKEILENSSKVHQVLTFCATVTGPLLGFLFSIKKVDLPLPNSMPFLALLPFAVIMPSIMLVRSSLNSTVRIASYVFVFYEEAGLGIGWQHAIQSCRQDRSKRGLGKGIELVFAILAVVSLVASMACLIALVVSGTSAASTPFLSVYAAVIAVLTVLTWWCLLKLRDTWHKENFDKMTNHWKKVLGATPTARSNSTLKCATTEVTSGPLSTPAAPTQT